MRLARQHYRATGKGRAEQRERGADTAGRRFVGACYADTIEGHAAYILCVLAADFRKARAPHGPVRTASRRSAAVEHA